MEVCLPFVEEGPEPLASRPRSRASLDKPFSRSPWETPGTGESIGPGVPGRDSKV